MTNAAAVKFTKGETRAMGEARRCARHGWAMGSGGDVRRSDIERLVVRGLLKDAGFCTVVDGDGYALVPERERQSWDLTDAGRVALSTLFPPLPV